MMSCASTPSTAEPIQRVILQSKDGRLSYPPDENGNRMPDFSHAGFKGGGVKLPEVPVAMEVQPGEGDDGKRVQDAIDFVAALPLDSNGFRGAVLLKKGEYQIEGFLRIAASGVVLRGEGQGRRGTTLVATGTSRRTLIVVSGGKGEQDLNADINDDRVRVVRDIGPREVRQSRVAITDQFVPVGSRRFNVDSSSGFKVGDAIMVHRPSTAEWISAIGMDRIPPRDDGVEIKQWEAGSRDLFFDRIITGIRGNQITIDAPLTNALERRWGGGSIYRYEYPERISNIGIENLRGVSKFRSDTDEDHAWTFIRLDVVENAWVRDVTSQHFAYGLVGIERFAKWITIQDCSCLDPKSQIIGSRRYSFALSGQLSLVQRCRTRNGRHDFVQREGQTPGPNVFLDCTAEKAHSDSGPHCRWSTGTLYDNVRIQDNDLNVLNRGNTGTGHGWTGANLVFWNCRADSFACENPPTAQNWAIGCRADEYVGNGRWISPGHQVKPDSLYLAQLRERLGAQAISNIQSRSD
jgi:hypothetical protein